MDQESWIQQLTIPAVSDDAAASGDDAVVASENDDPAAIDDTIVDAYKVQKGLLEFGNKSDMQTVKLNVRATP